MKLNLKLRERSWISGDPGLLAAFLQTGWEEAGPGLGFQAGLSGKGVELFGGLAGYLPCLGGRCDLR